MAAPGLVTDLNANLVAEWDREIAAISARTLANAREFYGNLGHVVVDHLTLNGDAALTPLPFAIDWGGTPSRYERALGRRRAEHVLSARTPSGQLGRIAQEEYLEWRDVRGSSNRLVRVEMTTETIDYWGFLAAHEPLRTLELIAGFAREASVDWRDVYGTGTDPFAADTTPERRRAAFERHMLIPRGGLIPESPYNNGSRAITCMAAGFNTLAAAVNLAAFGAQPLGAEGEDRPFTGSEAIAATATRAAVDCRNSDPTIYGAVVATAWNARKLAFADPAGVYIKDIRKQDVLLPDRSAPIPEEWWRLQRGGTLDFAGENFALTQRVVLEPPAGIGFTLGDCILAQSGEPLSSGADLARLVTVALYVKTSAEGTVAAQRLLYPRVEPSNCADPSDPIYAAMRSTADEIERRLEAGDVQPEPSRG